MIKMNVEKAKLITTFKSCLDILRDDRSTGKEALKNLTSLISLKLIEQHIGNEINIDDYKYNFEADEEDTAKLLRLARFSQLANEKEDNLPGNMATLWDHVLSVHNKTKNMFLKGQKFDINDASKWKKLIDKLNSLDLLNIIKKLFRILQSAKY
jgi:hypothetical protein